MRSSRDKKACVAGMEEGGDRRETGLYPMLFASRARLPGLARDAHRVGFRLRALNTQYSRGSPAHACRGVGTLWWCRCCNAQGTAARLP